MASDHVTDESVKPSDNRRCGNKQDSCEDANSVSGEKLSLGWIITISERGTIVIPKEIRPEATELEKCGYYLLTATCAGAAHMIILIPVDHAEIRNKKNSH